MKSGRPPSYAGGSIEDMEMLKCYKFRVAFDFFLFAAGECHLLGRKYLVVIVDVSHKYPKMYVVRPQFFIPIIALIRNAEKSTLSFKKELMEIKNQNMDITHFEENLNAAKERFMNNLRLSGKQFNSAIANIDKTIKNLEAIKENLRLTVKHMQAANNNLDDITIRKLVKGNPTMTAMFESQEQNPPDQ